MLRTVMLSTALALAACVADRTGEAIGVTPAIRWVTSNEISLSVNINLGHDICVPNYMWPAPYLSADVFRVTGADGRQARYIGEEPAVMRAIDHRIISHTQEEITVDLSTGYDLSGLAASISVEYIAPFRAC